MWISGRCPSRNTWTPQCVNDQIAKWPWTLLLIRYPNSPNQDEKTCYVHCTGGVNQYDFGGKHGMKWYGWGGWGGSYTMYNPETDTWISYVTDGFRRMEGNELYESRMNTLVHLVEHELNKAS